MRTALPTETHQTTSGVAEVWFRAMGADAQITVVGGPAQLVPMARRRIAELESCWSRFLPDSDLSALNAQSGRSVRVGADLAVAVAHAREAWALSGGAFDPTALAAVEAAGYDRSFERLTESNAAAPCDDTVERFGTNRVRSFLGCDDIELRQLPDDAGPGAPTDVMARIPAGSGIDLGGIGKGLAADLVVAELMADGAEGALVNLGGDLRVEGRSPTGLGWRIDVDHPHHAAPVATLLLHRGAVATSTTLKRRWRTRGGAVGHHLIDPNTRAPSDSDVELAVVLSGAAWRAEVLAKASLLRGSGRCFDLIDEHIDAALVVHRDGAMATTPNFDGYAARPLPASLPLTDQPHLGSPT
ncbi:MAG: FAD:protein FMN transferase [Microthrixaceae bacterium]